MKTFQKISRPTLIVNERICRANIKRMADKAKHSNVIFRPHFKTHQKLLIGDWFRDYGISAITVSSVSMAQKFANAGWDDITIAFPVNFRELNLINELASRIKLNLLIDSSDAVEILDREISSKVGVFIKINIGYWRSGIHFIDSGQIDKCADRLIRSKHLIFKGFLTHAGNTYHARDIEEIRYIYHHDMKILEELAQAYDEHAPMISIGDTPSCSIIEDLSRADEIRPGNFVFYDLMQYKLNTCSLDEIAVSVACPVCGIYPGRNEIITYGGAVHLSKEAIREQNAEYFGWVVSYNDDGSHELITDTKVNALSQEHGMIGTSNIEFLESLKYGDLLGIIPVHSCLTANLLQESMIII